MSDLNPSPKTQPPAAKSMPSVVALGASAGGVRALKAFFARVPPDSGAAWVVILHLSPEHESHLAEILQANVAIPVTQVTQRTRLETDHVYVIHPNTSLGVSDGHLIPVTISQNDQRRSPVDLLFRAVADSHGPRSVCIVLSGTGPNGSAGLKRVSEYGGLVIAQDPAEAEFPDMPRNAIATGLVDLVLPVAEMPSRVLDFVNHLSGGAATEVDARAAGGTSRAVQP